MNALFADEEVDAGNCKNDYKKNDRSGRCKGGISPALTVKSVIDISYDRIHPRNIQLASKERATASLYALNAPIKPVMIR